MKIAIIIGHGKSRTGGYDPGAVNGNFHEFKLAKEIGKAACDELQTAYGADCVLVNYDGSMKLTDKIARFQTREYGFLAEIHLNAGNAAASGTEVYFMPGDNVGKGYAAAVSAALAAALSIPNRGAKPDSGGNYGIIQKTTPTALLVETCFISNPGDLGRINNASGQKLAGRAIADGIAKAAGLKRIQNPETHGTWKKDNRGWWYQNANGTYPRNSWIQVDNKWYWVDIEGYAVKGWQTIQGKVYYFSESSYHTISECQLIVTNSSGTVL